MCMLYTPRESIKQWQREKFRRRGGENHLSIKSNDIRSVSPLHVHDGNDDSNLILQQIFIVIAFVLRPM